MSKRRLSFAAALRIFLIAVHSFSALAFGQTLRLSVSRDAETRRPIVRVDGPSGTAAALECSARIPNGEWNQLATFTLSGAPFIYPDPAAAASAPRFYRVKAGAVPNPELPDLALSPNAVFTPAEGFDTVQYAADGTLGYLFWRDRNLVLRERSSGGWSEQVIATDGNAFDPAAVLQYRNFQSPAVLAYDFSSRPHIFRVSDGASISHHVRNGAIWARAEHLIPAGAGPISKLLASAGPSNVLHVAVCGSNGSIVYGTTRSGSWQWSTVVTVGSDPYWMPGSYARRWFSMAVDSRNFAHLVFRPAFTMDAPGGYPLAYTQLWYASNRSGSWARSLVRQPDDPSGEVGSGMSIAIGPDDLPAIASWYNERGPGGSSQWSRLQYYKMTGSGNWARSEILSRPETYQAGDGEKGTGAQPYLRFDPQGHPHVLFLDHASEHFPFQNEYAGNLRHGWWNGSQWVFETLFRQDKPLQGQAIFPAFALSANELTATVLERATQWNTLVNPQVATSSYRFRVITAPLR